jgi:hypothetical protein
MDMKFIFPQVLAYGKMDPEYPSFAMRLKVGISSRKWPVILGSSASTATINTLRPFRSEFPEKLDGADKGSIFAVEVEKSWPLATPPARIPGPNEVTNLLRVIGMIDSL